MKKFNPKTCAVHIKRVFTDQIAFDVLIDGQPVGLVERITELLDEHPGVIQQKLPLLAFRECDDTFARFADSLSAVEWVVNGTLAHKGDEGGEIESKGPTTGWDFGCGAVLLAFASFVLFLMVRGK